MKGVYEAKYNLIINSVFTCKCQDESLLVFEADFSVICQEPVCVVFDCNTCGQISVVPPAQAKFIS